MSDWKQFQSGCGMCKKSTDYYSIGGSQLEKINNMFFKKNLGINYATSGGKKVNQKKSSTKSKKSSKSGVTKTRGKDGKMYYFKHGKRVSKSMVGGDTNWGQTGFPLRYYGSNTRVTPASGLGVESAYGKIDPKDVGVGNLAPFNTAKLGPRATNQQTGGKKSKSKKKSSTKSKKSSKLGVTKTRGKDGKMYYFKNGKRVSKSAARK